jgi:hypothetical protein
MGIYSDGSIYGVCLIVNGEEVYKRVYEERMNREGITELKVEYEKIKDEDIIIRFYTNCSSTYNSGITGTFTTWFPGSRETLEKLINSI